MKKEQNFKIYYFLGGFIIALVVVYHLGKKIGGDKSASSIEFLEEKLSFYNSIDSLKLPIMVASLNRVNLDLNNVMSKVISVSDLSKINDSLENLSIDQINTIQLLDENLRMAESGRDSLLKEFNKLSERIPVLNSERQDYKLKEGEGVFLVKNLISMGIVNISRSKVIFNINNTRDSLSVGNQLVINIGKRKGVLALTLVNEVDVSNPYCRMEFLLIK